MQASVVPTSYAGKHDHRSPTDLPQVSTAIEQVEMIIGRSADAEFLDVVRQLTIATLRCTMECAMPCTMPCTTHQVREMAETHDPGALLDCMRAYHFGPKFLVEVEIVTANPNPSPYPNPKP